VQLDEYLTEDEYVTHCHSRHSCLSAKTSSASIQAHCEESSPP
jgi:hypothetical protein